jgi:hypothetical protein
MFNAVSINRFVGGICERQLTANAAQHPCIASTLSYGQQGRFAQGRGIIVWLLHAWCCCAATHWVRRPCPNVCLDDLGSGGVADQVAAAIRPAGQHNGAKRSELFFMCCKHMPAAEAKKEIKH